MALKKPITQSDGVVTEYHRVFFIESVINSHISIAVFSYVNANVRQMETDGGTPYKVCVTYEKDYAENMTIEEAYSYLKSLPDFEGAEDV